MKNLQEREKVEEYDSDVAFYVLYGLVSLTILSLLIMLYNLPPVAN